MHVEVMMMMGIADSKPGSSHRSHIFLELVVAGFA